MDYLSLLTKIVSIPYWLIMALLILCGVLAITGGIYCGEYYRNKKELRSVLNRLSSKYPDTDVVGNPNKKQNSKSYLS